MEKPAVQKRAGTPTGDKLSPGQPHRVGVKALRPSTGCEVRLCPTFREQGGTRSGPQSQDTEHDVTCTHIPGTEHQHPQERPPSRRDTRQAARKPVC